MIYCWLPWVFTAAQVFLQLRRTGAALSSQSTGSQPCLDFSSCSAWALEYRLRSCGARVWLLHSLWDLPRSGIEPMSPALVVSCHIASEPPEKTRAQFLNSSFFPVSKRPLENRNILL